MPNASSSRSVGPDPPTSTTAGNGAGAGAAGFDSVPASENPLAGILTCSSFRSPRWGRFATTRRRCPRARRRPAARESSAAAVGRFRRTRSGRRGVLPGGRARCLSAPSPSPMRPVVGLAPQTIRRLPRCGGTPAARRGCPGNRLPAAAGLHLRRDTLRRAPKQAARQQEPRRRIDRVGLLALAGRLPCTALAAVAPPMTVVGIVLSLAADGSSRVNSSGFQSAV